MIRREVIRVILYVLTAAASVAAWIYINLLAEELEDKEMLYSTLWGDAVRELESVDLDGNVSFLAYKIIDKNSIPVILMHDNTLLSYRNVEVDTSDCTAEEFLVRKTNEMHTRHDPIMIEYKPGQYDILFYDDSSTLKKLKVYPAVQFAVTLIIIILLIVAVRNTSKADQNKILVGMSKETAHQLGTPISSLLAWIEILKAENYNTELTAEVEKDVKRLEKITDRFSRIGNKPELKHENICPVLENSVNYLKSRTSKNVNYVMDIPEHEIMVMLNVSLFEWVIENLCKNAVDAMQGRGKLSISLKEENGSAVIDISDTGKGLLKRNFKKIFRPGFTTKKHGWGLGLSLAQRIVGDYHKGKIFVKSSQPNKGTTFRIILPM